MKATVVIVVYRSEDVLPGCLASIPADMEVVVVNQSLVREHVETLALQTRPDARVIAAGRNRGFGAGCNLGAANARGEVVIFLNPDARFLDDAGERLVEASLQHGGTLVGPRIVDEGGAEITRARNWSSPCIEAFNLLVPLRMQPKMWQRDLPADDAVYTTGGEVPYVQGACMAIGRERFVATGGFDEAFFLFGEEEFLARRLRADGSGVFLEPRATIAHAEHTSTSKTGGFAAEQYFRTAGVMYRRVGALDRSVGLVRGTARALPVLAALIFLLVTAPVRRRVGYRKHETNAWCRSALLGLVRGVLLRPVLGGDPATPAANSSA
jgi:N-acetylglucosaminyl-diphospho-decaprenol L-rhamnosyltransferase